MLGSQLVLVVLFGVSVVTGCRGNNESKVSRSPPTVFWPKKDVAGETDGMWKSMDPGDTDMKGNGKWANRFWLKFDGGTLTKAESFIVEKSGSDQVIPPFASADIGSTTDLATLKNTLLTTVKSLYQGVSMEISIDAPKAPFATVYVGGKNFTGRPNVLGVSPLDIGNWSGEDILFAFSQEFTGKAPGEALLLLSQTIAHEMAHSLGARHIANDKAVMNPSVVTTANGFDETGTYAEGDGSENTQTVLVMNVGKANLTSPATGLPEISDLDIKSEGSVAQFSVFSLANIQKNAAFKLGDFTYNWTLGTLKAVGPTIRVRFRDSNQQTLVLTVANDAGETKSFDFTVGKIPGP